MRNNEQDSSRRKFIKQVGAGVGFAVFPMSGAWALPAVESIEVQTLWEGGPGKKTWFHPRGCMVPGDPKPTAFMTIQEITGSDVFGHVHLTQSTDMGKTWTDPEPIAPLAPRTMDNGWVEGICDVVPEWHEKSGAVLAIGHNVYYKDGKLTSPASDRHPVYLVHDPKTGWSAARQLEWDDPRGTGIYTCGCGQRHVMENGDVLIPLSFGPKEKTARSVSVARCTFDGRDLKIVSMGNELSNGVKRGLLEPSMIEFGGRYYMTIRAEDDRGHVTVSDNGLEWATQRPWAWDDGEPLTMSTTQQHWMKHKGVLYLVYTRKDEANAKVMRWRSPLYIAAVDPDTLRLDRASERVVFPLNGDGVNAGDQVARMGNFHVTHASPDESWVTVGETLPKNAWQGNTLLGRVR